MTKAFPESRFNVLTLGVRNKAAMIDFYVDTLGFKRFGQDDMIMLDTGGFVLGLWEADKLAKDSGLAALSGDQSGFRGFAMAYNARSETEVDEIFERLMAAGANITVEPHKAFWGGYSGYFTDPEGNAWEVAYNPYWPVTTEGRLDLPSA